MRDYAKLYDCLKADLTMSEPLPITSDLGIDAVRATSLMSSFLKKNVDVVKPDSDAKCLELFLECNSRCQVFELQPRKLFHDVVVNEMKIILEDCFIDGPSLRVGLSDLDERLMPGPGASLGARSYNFYSKLFDSPLTYTGDRLPYYYTRAVRQNPTWANAEKARDSRFGMRKVVGNSLSFVPKTSTISRSICTEPSLNMLYQKALGSVFEDQLRRKFKISLTSQPELNRSLAWLGSTNGSFGTIDLKSASDSVSLNLLKEIMPAFVFDWIKDFRSPHVTLPGGSVVELHMVSSMGNGFTFPLQTLIFAACVRACYQVLGIKPKYSKRGPSNFGVFGDDIVVRKDAYQFVVECLEMLGFTVNITKSFNVGAFRESCGGDYYDGHLVRGVYVKSLSQQSDVYSTINRLMRWSARSGIPLVHTINQISGGLRFLPVPFHAGDTEGLKVPFKALKRITRDENQCIYYDALVPLPTSFKAPTGEAENRHYPGKTNREIGYNPEGLVVSFVGGYIRDGRITLRDESHEGLQRFKVRRRKTPHWDYYDSADQSDRVRDWEVMYEMMAQLCPILAG